MPLHEVFLFEGQSDSIFRNEAARVMTALLRDMRSAPELFKIAPRTVNVKGGTVPSIPGNLLLEFSFAPGTERPQAEFMPTKTGAKALIRFYVQVDVNESGFDPFEWLISNPAEWRDAFVHEYVHYLDWTRVGSDDWRRSSHGLDAKQKKYSPDGKLRKYYQDPFEQNAIFQQIADILVQEVTPDAARRMGVDNFYRLFVKRMQEGSIGAPSMYRERQIPHLKKRVAQLYNEIAGSNQVG